MTHNTRPAAILQSGVDTRKAMWAEFLKEVSIGTRPWAGQSRFRIPPGTKYLSLLQYIQTISGAHPSSFSVGTRVFAWGKAAEV